VKFNYRSSSIQELKDGSRSGQINIWRSKYVTGARTTKDGSLSVRFPESALEWFRRIPTDYNSRASIIAIVRIGKSGDGHSAEILGREIKTDTKGSHIVW
jgi:hypothetical protein